MGSLQDALIRSGLVDEEKAKKEKRSFARKPNRAGAARKHASAHSGGRKKFAGKKAGKKKIAGGKRDDLARAYEARKKAELAEKERAKQARVADQETRRRRNLQLDGIVEGKILNVEDAEIPRYFQHLDRIRRVLCTPEQREKINAGELGVVNLRGRYLIVDPETLAAYNEVAPDLVPDLSGKEPEAEEGGDYPPVPDDITW